LGRPFLTTAKAIIYADAGKIVFTINGRKEIFNFKNKILKAHAHPRYPYPQEHEPIVEKKRRDRRRNKKNNQPLRTMCGSRIGGWSLPGVMSD
jgi:hypothetical protein